MITIMEKQPSMEEVLRILREMHAAELRRTLRELYVTEQQRECGSALPMPEAIRRAISE